MKIIVAAIGTHGDVFPLLGIAAELARRGHTVTFLANDHFRTTIERHGVAFHSLGSEEEYQAFVTDPKLWYAIDGLETLWKSVEPMFERIYNFVAIQENPQEFAFIAHPLTALAARVAEDKFGLSLIKIHLAPQNLRTVHSPLYVGPVHIPDWLPHFARHAFWRFVDWQVVDKIMLPGLNRLRAHARLPKVGRVLEYWHDGPARSLTLFPEWFAARPPDWPQNLTTGEFPLWNAASNETLSAEVEAFIAAGEPPVLFTLGSGMHYAYKFFHISKQVCIADNVRGNIRAIFCSTHINHIPGPLPAHILYVPHAPFTKLLPKVSAIVHHGGIGTCAEALRAATPQIVMPLSHDQFDNGGRIETLGAGIVIKRLKYETPLVRTRLAALLANTKIHERCAELAQRFDKSEAIPRLCNQIETALAKNKAGEGNVPSPA
jgi:rhamnosyltransferase subunit B